MCPLQIEIARALASCSFPPATGQKRFARDMGFHAENMPDKPLTVPQARYLYEMAHRYRRQLSNRVVGYAQALAAELPPKESVTTQSKNGKGKGRVRGGISDGVPERASSGPGQLLV